MLKLKPHPQNVPGDFYVEDGCCTMCLVPFTEAPEMFGEVRNLRGDSHCFVKRQPQTRDEVDKMLNAIRCAELMCIRYRGTDRRIQLEIVEADVGFVCDDLPPDLQQRVDEAQTNTKLLWEDLHRVHPRRPWWKFWA